MAGLVSYTKRLVRERNIKKEWLVLGLRSSANKHVVLTPTKNISKPHSRKQSNDKKHFKDHRFNTLITSNFLGERNHLSWREKLVLAFGFGLMIAECKRQMKTGSSHSYITLSTTITGKNLIYYYFSLRFQVF